MNTLLSYLITPVSPVSLDIALCLMRIGIGILTIGHGIPKVMGGMATWRSLGMAMNNVGIHFLPVMWGFLGANTEFFGGIALVLGLGTRIASLLLIIMMTVACMMHVKNGDPFSVYSFSLSLIIVFITFFFIGSGTISLDYYLASKS